MKELQLPSYPSFGQGLHNGIFRWALAALVGLDYFDQAIFSFFAPYIAGGINASIDELVWSSSTYAVGAVLGILQQRHLSQRLGYRVYIAGCVLLYSIASVVAATCDTSIALAFARGVQGYAIGPVKCTARILIQTKVTSPQRPPALRAFALLIVVGGALAPIVGGLLVSRLDWRALFACVVPAALFFGACVFFTIPANADQREDAIPAADLSAYIIFAVSQCALQIVMQRVRFELFTTSPELIGLAACGIFAIGWFAYRQWNHPAPFVRLHGLQQRSFRTGLLLYIFYYYLSTALGYLFARFLEEGLGYPIENAGFLFGFTSFASATALFAYLKYSKLIPNKRLLIVPGFLIALTCTSLMTRLPPSVSQSVLMTPLILRGLFVFFVILPVANATFRIFQPDDYAHSYRLKEIVRQLAISFATCSMIILEQHRQALHQTRLAEFANPFNPAFQEMFRDLTNFFVNTGHSITESHTLAMINISNTVTQQASFIASLDGFRFLACVALCGAIIAALQDRID